MTQKKVTRILYLLDDYYGPMAKCYLNHDTPWQLLIATMLSAQCTDDRVNRVTKDLFVQFPTLEAFATADLSQLEKAVYPTGFYKNKALNIQLCARQLIDTHNHHVPDTLEALTALRGVGRKTANVILGNIYNQPSIVVDTHVKRISKKLGFTQATDPEKIEYDLMKILPKDHWIRYNTQVIAHGRTLCKARKPDCANCFLQPECSFGQLHLN